MSYNQKGSELYELAHNASIRAIISYWGLELKHADGHNYASILGGGGHALQINEEKHVWRDFSNIFSSSITPKSGNQVVGGDPIDLVGYLFWVYNGEPYISGGDVIKSAREKAVKWIGENICKINSIQLNISKQEKPAGISRTDYSQISVQETLNPKLLEYLTVSRSLGKDVVQKLFVQLNRGKNADGTPATYGVFIPNITSTPENPSGEFRNNLSKYNKLTIGPKNISCLYSDWTWRTGGVEHVPHSGNLIIVEGMISGASFIDILGVTDGKLPYDLLILNSVGEVSKVHDIIAHYRKVISICDADISGDKATEAIRGYVDEHNDYCREHGIDDNIVFIDRRYMLVRDEMEDKYNSEMPALQERNQANTARGITDPELLQSIDSLYKETCFNDLNDYLKDICYKEKLEQLNKRTTTHGKGITK